MAEDFKVDSKNFYELKTKVSEVHAYLFGSSDIRYDQSTKKPLFYMMPDIEQSVKIIAEELKLARRYQPIRDVLLAVALASGVIGLITSIYALSIALQIAAG